MCRPQAGVGVRSGDSGPGSGATGKGRGEEQWSYPLCNDGLCLWSTVVIEAKTSIAALELMGQGLGNVLAWVPSA